MKLHHLLSRLRVYHVNVFYPGPIAVWRSEDADGEITTGLTPPSIEFDGTYVPAIGEKPGHINRGEIENELARASKLLAEMESLGFNEPDQLTDHLDQLRERLHQEKRKR